MGVKPLRMLVSQEQRGECFKSAQLRGGKRGLLGFLKRFEVSFESLAIFVLGFDFGLELLDEELEPANFIAQLLHLRGCGR